MGQNPGNEGGKSGYWEGVNFKIMKQIGDYNAIYRDRSSVASLIPYSHLIS